jgi:hypothetical protein
MSAFSAFRSFSKYDETRPLRWRAFFVQGAYDCARYAYFVLTFPITVLVLVTAAVTWPFWKLHELCASPHCFEWLGRPMDPIRKWWKQNYDEIHPIFIKASGSGIITRKQSAEVEIEEA